MEPLGTAQRLRGQSLLLPLPFLSLQYCELLRLLSLYNKRSWPSVGFSDLQ